MIKERIKNVREKFSKYSEKTLLSYQNALFFVIVVDLIGIYYFMGLKSLGTAILIVSLAFLGLIMFLLQKFPNKKEKSVKKPKDKPKPSNNPIEFDMGLGNSEDYNKRLEKAMGVI